MSKVITTFRLSVPSFQEYATSCPWWSKRMLPARFNPHSSLAGRNNYIRMQYTLGGIELAPRRSKSTWGLQVFARRDLPLMSCCWWQRTNTGMSRRAGGPSRLGTSSGQTLTDGTARYAWRSHFDHALKSTKLQEMKKCGVQTIISPCSLSQICHPAPWEKQQSIKCLAS